MNRTLRPLRARGAGFTLLEIMLVIIIIVTLMAVLLPSLMKSSEDAKIGQARIYVGQLQGSLARYSMANSGPPSSAQGLRALVERPGGDPAPRRWSSILDKIEPDPWGTEYKYEYPGKHNPKNFDVYSCGPDKTPNTPDDVGNWD